MLICWGVASYLKNHGKLFFFFFPISYENFFWDFSIWFLFLNRSLWANQMFLKILPLAKVQLWPLPNSPIKPHLAQVKKSKWFLLRPKRSFMLLYCFLLIKAVILVEIVPKDDNKLFHTFFCQSIPIDSPWIFWRENKIWNDLFFRLLPNSSPHPYCWNYYGDIIQLCNFLMQCYKGHCVGAR